MNHGPYKPFRSERWSFHTVHKMLLNFAYLGQPVACRVSKGWFHKINKDRPAAVKINDALLQASGAKCIPITKRVKDDWYQTPPPEGQSHAVLITDAEVYHLAEIGINRYWGRWAASLTPKSNRDKHKNSLFFLKKVLHSKQGKPSDGWEKHKCAS